MASNPRRAADRPTLETARLRLRRPAEADIPDIVAIVNDWDVARRLTRLPYPYGANDARFFLEMIVPNEWVWAITLRETGKLAGVVGLRPATEPDTAELGYYVARSHWGIGIATEAARAVLDHGIRGLGLRTFISGHFADNPASGRVLHKLGFVETGRAERASLSLGAAAPSVELRLDVRPG